MGYVTWLRSKVGHEPVFLTCASVAVLDEDGRVLLARRGDREIDVWGLPGGMMELGESVSETATREMREETGLEVVVEGTLGIYSKYQDAYPNGDRAQVVNTVLLARLVGGVRRLDGYETLELAYVDPKDPPPLLNDQHRDAVADLASGERGIIR